MKRLSSGTIGIDQGAVTLFSDFESGGEMWTGAGPRDARQKVKFSTPFRLPPAVHVTLSMLDIDRRQNQRFDLATEAVTSKGMEIVFRTWDDTKIARARATWMAIGELEDDEDWALY
jgi:hypothetical protein